MLAVHEQGIIVGKSVCVCVLSTGDEKKREDLTTTYLPMSSS
jgi:hypothetical protein